LRRRLPATLQAVAAAAAAAAAAAGAAVVPVGAAAGMFTEAQALNFVMVVTHVSCAMSQ